MLLDNSGRGRTDICLQEHGHAETLEPTPHVGDRFGTVWRNYLDASGKKRREVLDDGAPEEGARTVAGKPRQDTSLEAKMVDPGTDYEKLKGEAAAS
jgi:hypothetical protein